MTSEDVRPVRYDSLKICGYIGDGVPEGFKTPTFKNGGLPQLQVVGDDDLVLGFEAYDDQSDRRVVGSNSLEDHWAVRGKPPIYCFKPSLGPPILGRRYSIAPKLRQWIRREDRGDDGIDPIVAFDVLVFIGAPREVIEQAANRLVASLQFKSEIRRDSYRRRLLSIADTSFRGRSNEGALNSDGLAGRLTVESLLSDLDIEISKSTPDRASLLRSFKDEFIVWLSSTEDKPLRARAAQLRGLVRLLGEVEGQKFEGSAARKLVRFAYFRNVFRRYALSNQYSASQLDEPLRVLHPRDVSDLLNCPPGDFLASCVTACSKIPPRLTRGHRYVKPGVVVFGEVVNVEVDRVLVSNGGRSFAIEENLLSTQSYLSRPFVGDLIVFSVKLSNGGSCRGEKFVRQVLGVFFPFDDDESLDLDVTLGASNSWAILKMPAADKGHILFGGGGFINQLTELLGLRRLTVIGRYSDDEDGHLKEFKDFINSSWQAIKIDSFENGRIVLTFPVEDVEYFDERKMRTFKSMVNKVYPSHELEIHVRDEVSSRLV